MALIVAGLPAPSFAAHPLITDDTGTQGKGKALVEINASHAWDDEDVVRTRTLDLGGVVSYGAGETVDVILGVPYQRIRTETDGSTADSGVSDVSLEVKWRLWEAKGLSLAVKPGLTLPTGDETRGLGAGKTGYSTFLLSTADLGSAAVHLNAGFRRNENSAGEREGIWHVSMAGEAGVTRNLKVVGNVGMERSPDRSSGTNPAFGLVGLIYSVSERLSLDAGAKAGLNKPQTDLALLAGLAYKF